MNIDLDSHKGPLQAELPAELPLLGGCSAPRAEFLHNIGHEIRNPLTSILAHVEALMDGIYGPLKPAQQTSLQAVHDSAQHTLHLIADLIDLGLLESGALALTPTATSMHESCEKALESMAAAARSRSIQMSSEIHPPHLTVMADARRMRQLITELLSAAMLAVPSGGQVRLCINAVSSGLCLRACSHDVTLSSAAVQALATEEGTLHSPLFSRLQKIKPIGMALLQQLVRLQGGTFTQFVLNEHASSLSIHLPLDLLTTLESAPPHAEHRTADPSVVPEIYHHRQTILIADDNTALVTVTRSYLESLGFHVVTARDGCEAVHLTLTLKPNLILMDVRMPVLDGLSAIQQIRASPDPQIRDITIVSLSGHLGAADKEKCLAAGANLYLNKPFGVKELDRILADYISSD